LLLSKKILRSACKRFAKNTQKHTHMININTRIKITQQEIGIYLKVIDLDNPNTNITQKAQLISDTFDVECNVEDINKYYQVEVEAYEPDWEWLNDIKRGR